MFERGIAWPPTIARSLTPRASRDAARAVRLRRVSAPNASARPRDRDPRPALARAGRSGSRASSRATSPASRPTRRSSGSAPRGANVWDVDGNRFVDLGAGFGVANAGHAHPRVVAARRASRASACCTRMGDVHPSAVKVELLERLAALFPGGGPARAVLGSSGSDAVEIALKTALLATGRAGVVAFEGAYHGLALGALDATLGARLPRAVRRAAAAARPSSRASATPTTCARAARDVARPDRRGAGRADPGPRRRAHPAGRLPRRAARALRSRGLAADRRRGLHRIRSHRPLVRVRARGRRARPALRRQGPRLGHADLRVHRPRGRDGRVAARRDGEALHTQTFLGHPPGCAAALASIAVLEEEKLVERARRARRRRARAAARAARGRRGVADVRGRGLLLAIECDDAGARAARVRDGAARGVIVVPSGDDGRVIAITPPLSIERRRARRRARRRWRTCFA